MDSDRQIRQYSHDTNQQQQQQQQRNHQPASSGLMRYRSAPSSYFANLMNSSGLGNDVVENCDEFLNPSQASPETERILSRFMSGGGTEEDSSSHSLRGVQQNASVSEALQSQFPTDSVKHGAEIFGHGDQQQNSNYSSGSHMMYHNSVASNSEIDNSFRMGSLPQMKIGGGGGGGGGGNSNLIRHSSSPAGFFSHINVENGYGAMRGMGNFGGGNGTNAEASFPSPSRLKRQTQMDFSSAPSSSPLGRMTPILENRSKSMEITGFPIGSWDDSSIISDGFLKEIEEDDDRKAFSVMNNASENQNAEGGNRPPHMLSHHLSLPTSSAELSAMEKLLHFQDSVPCKIRAKRGFATHPRSIAERVRRTRISERIRKLQELVPNMDKQTNTSDMLDLAVDYIKELQGQLQILTENRAKCTCSNKQRQ